jgi:hypothetical protein
MDFKVRVVARHLPWTPVLNTRQASIVTPRSTAESRNICSRQRTLTMDDLMKT